MFRNNGSDKKRTLLARKEKLLQEIQYYETKIDEFSKKSSNVYFGADSSDSEDGFPTYLDIGPSVSELKRQDRLLKTCLQATQELTSVTVLESEVQILVKDPDIENEKPVSEPGLWREVTAECRIDLVPFTILFYVHQPSPCFSAACYRGLRVAPVKAAQEAELAASLLHSLNTPADVLETIRSYAVAYRSRRGSLARLADRHDNSLYMQPRENGGFILKCGSVMQMSWRLENKTSPLAPFQHKMNFELEYMDESFLKIIKQTYRQLSDPSLQTDERTQLLSKIINTCIEAQGQDNMESDTDSKKLDKTTLDDDDDDVNVERDREVMAPPKAIPKRSKPKGKENDDGNRKSVKRNAEEIVAGVKKARTLDVTNGVTSKNKVNGEVVDKSNNSKVTGKTDEKSDYDNVKISQSNPSDKRLSKKITKTDQDKSLSDPKKKTNDLEKKSLESKEKSARNGEAKNNKENNEQNKQSEKVTVNSKNPKNKTNTDISKNSKIRDTVHAKTKDSNLKKTGNSNGNKKIENPDASNNKSDTSNTKAVTNSDSANTKKLETDNKNTKSTKPNSTSVKANSDKPKKILRTDVNAKGKQIENKEDEIVKLANTNNVTAKKAANLGTDKAVKKVNTGPITAKSNNTKTKESGNTNAKKIPNLETDIAKKSVNNPMNSDTNNKLSSAKKNTKKTITNSLNNSKNQSKDTKSVMVIKNHRNSSGKVTKKTLKPSIGKESKIPQKKLSPAYAAVLEQNPVRISPRMLSKFKSSSDSNIQPKLFKPITNIPRLLKKPTPKSK